MRSHSVLQHKEVVFTKNQKRLRPPFLHNLSLSLYLCSIQKSFFIHLILYNVFKKQQKCTVKRSVFTASMAILSLVLILDFKLTNKSLFSLATFCLQGNRNRVFFFKFSACNYTRVSAVKLALNMAGILI